MSSEIIQSVAYDNQYDDFHNVNVIFSQTRHLHFLITKCRARRCGVSCRHHGYLCRNSDTTGVPAAVVVCGLHAHWPIRFRNSFAVSNSYRHAGTTQQVRTYPCLHPGYDMLPAFIARPSRSSNSSRRRTFRIILKERNPKFQKKETIFVISIDFLVWNWKLKNRRVLSVRIDVIVRESVRICILQLVGKSFTRSLS